MTKDNSTPITSSEAARDYLVGALRLDLIGPRPQDVDLQRERLHQTPSRWYLTGFLVPSDAPLEQRAQDDEEEFDEPAEQTYASDDSSMPERGSGKRNFLPSSIGLNVIVDNATERLDVNVTWGDYIPEAEGSKAENPAPEDGDAPDSSASRVRYTIWERIPRQGSVSIQLSETRSGSVETFLLPGNAGLQIACLVRPTAVRTASGNIEARAVSLFLVNRRNPIETPGHQDAAYVFQVEMAVKADRPFVAQPNPHGLDSDDWDERLSDLHFRDVSEYAVGYSVSTSAELQDGLCHHVKTEWMPQGLVQRTVPAQIDGVEFGMEALGALQDGVTAKSLLNPLVDQYREWIQTQGQLANSGDLSERRQEVAEELVKRAEGASERIQAGIDLLETPDVLEAFCIANRAMAAAARRRLFIERGTAPTKGPPPTWRPFQLAYILMNLRSIVEPDHPERNIVDLLFFPTGGGKTEAYLGLAAFTLVWRRLQNPHPTYRGMSVLMRYTLRLLTLDQLGRAAAMICALELEREQDEERLGEWPFEIALWVGQAATPNRMGSKDDRSNYTARAKTLRFASNSSNEPPIPLEQCPWCGRKFTRYSFDLSPNSDYPDNLLVRCVRRRCAFSGDRHLPIITVDEPIYSRLPAFMVATADKFAAMPWSGETAGFFHGGDPANPRPLDLIIQDELHLISGPLGTMAGLYETAIDNLSTRRIGDKDVGPKITASTATARMADEQVRALFNRHRTEVFPAPGIDRRDSFFAQQVSEGDTDGRLYVGVAAAGRGPKVVFLRTMVTLMAAAQAVSERVQGIEPNPADPYLTVVAYFNALRELGSARRIVEDEVSSRLTDYSRRRRLNDNSALFADRYIAVEPVELTSRVGTADVAEAKRRLGLLHSSKGAVDVALATNMISVGLDITRLGLMVVSGQPKTTSEYIQSTSRVGRDSSRPGLVVTLLNVHKPRDRSHYERFTNYHESFYRSVEATSVTPFSPRAMDRGLPAVTVALTRLGIDALTPTDRAGYIEDFISQTGEIASIVGERARSHAEVKAPDEDIEVRVRARVQSLIDDWAVLANEAKQSGVVFGYSVTRNSGVSTPLLREIIDPSRHTLTDKQLLFRAPRSLRDVEPSVLLSIQTPEGNEIS